MTTLTKRMIKGHFVVSGPDIQPMRFKSRPEARDWCKAHHPGSPITEIGPGGKLAAKKPLGSLLVVVRAPRARRDVDQ
jgi:hypothetical protein